jgi:hypothetical protein
MSDKLTTKEQLELAFENYSVAISFYEGKGYSTLNSALLGLLKEAKRENGRLLLSLNELTLASLAVRNLFEIYLIFKHVYSDEKALFSWFGQSHKDSKEVTDGFITLMEKKGLDTAELREIKKFEDESLEQSPFQSKGGFQVRNLAEKYGCLDDYQFIYKLSSKLVHPSSMKVMAYDTLTENTNYLSVVLQTGVYFSQEFSLFLQSVIHENA